MLDNTGSMWGATFNAMYNAADDLVDIIYGDESRDRQSLGQRRALTATVNIGTGPHRLARVRRPGADQPGPLLATDAWKGCVMARADAARRQRRHARPRRRS